jgi:hypothetical protein
MGRSYQITGAFSFKHGYGGLSFPCLGSYDLATLPLEEDPTPDSLKIVIPFSNRLCCVLAC